MAVQNASKQISRCDRPTDLLDALSYDKIANNLQDFATSLVVIF